MKICVALNDSINTVWQENLDEIANADLIVFGFNGLGLVSYKKELSGETEYFHDIANLSKQISSVVISGCDTDTYGVFRHSAVIADNGRLAGVSDMLYSIDGSEYAPGGNLRVYDTTCGKIAVIIGEDLFFNDVISTLSLCDAELIICLYKNIDNFMPQTVAKAQAFCNGVDIMLCSKEQFFYVDSSGKMKISSYKNITNTEIKIHKEYHTLSSRKRCLGRETKGE